MILLYLLIIVPLLIVLSSLIKIEKKVVAEFKQRYWHTNLQEEEFEKQKEEKIQKLLKESRRHKRGTGGYGSYDVVYKRSLSFGLGYDENYFFIFAVSFLAIAWVITIGMALATISHEADYLQKQNEYNILVAQVERIENGEFQENYIVNGEVGSLSSVYDDIKRYNDWVIKHQYWNENSWVSFFYNDYADNLELIKLE